METNESEEPSQQEERKAAESLSLSLSLQGDTQQKPPSGIWYLTPPSPLSSPFLGLTSFTWPSELSWMMYCCILVLWEAKRPWFLLDGVFVYKPGRVRCWCLRILQLHHTSHKKRKCFKISPHMCRLSSPRIFTTHFLRQTLLYLISQDSFFSV